MQVNNLLQSVRCATRTMEERTWSRPLSPTSTMNERWFFLTLLLMRIGIRGSSCLRIFERCFWVLVIGGDSEEDGQVPPRRALATNFGFRGLIGSLRLRALRRCLPWKGK